jgi:predicted dehydrogenase
MWAPKLDGAEALRLEAAHFVDCVKNQKRPITDGHAGLRVVRILEAANESLRAHGRRVELRYAAEAA